MRRRRMSTYEDVAPYEDTTLSTKEAVLSTVQQDGMALEHAPTELKNDLEVVLAAVLQTGHALWYASDALRNDRVVVLAAVRRSGDALQFASEEMRSDPEVVHAAVRQVRCSCMRFTRPRYNPRRNPSPSSGPNP